MIFFETYKNRIEEITYNENNFKCLSFEIIEYFGKDANYYGFDKNNKNNTIFLPELFNVQSDPHKHFVESTILLNESNININCIYSFIGDNKGFDSLLFGFEYNNKTEKHEVIAIVIEHKYCFSKVYSNYDNAYVSIDANMVSENWRIMKELVLPKLKNNLNIYKVYYLIIGTQKHETFDLDVTIQNDLKNVIIIGSDPNKQNNIFEQSALFHYYGSVFSQMMSFTN